MVRLYIIVRRKGSKRFLGAIPTKADASPKAVRNIARRLIKKSLEYRVIDASQLRRLVFRMKPRGKRINVSSFLKRNRRRR